MGTNFYLKRIPTKDDIRVMHVLVDAKKFISAEYNEDIYDSVQNLLNAFTKLIHIGKRSGGWQFTFDHNNGKYWKPNRESLNLWLSKPEYVILDEYGNKYAPSDFWHHVGFHNININNYRTSESEHNIAYVSERKTIKELFGIDTEWGSFTVDGLTFSAYTDFS